MTKRHKRTRNLTVGLTVFVAASLFIYGLSVQRLKKEVDIEIAKQQDEVNEKNRQLTELQQQYEAMDSEEYVRKIATEELGMVDEDTIVFQIKN